MKRLCVFYRLADRWQGKPVDWIICKECQRKIANGQLQLPAVPRPRVTTVAVNANADRRIDPDGTVWVRGRRGWRQLGVYDG